MENVARQSPWRRARCLFALSERRDLITLLALHSPFISESTHDVIQTKLTHFPPQIRFGLSVQSCVSAVEWLGLCQQKKGDERNDWYSGRNQQDTDNNSKVLCANLSRWRLKVFSGLKVSLLSDVQGQDKLFKTLDWWVTGSSFLWTC